MDTHPYHNYLFFDLGNDFYKLPDQEQATAKHAFMDLVILNSQLISTVSSCTAG